MYTYIYVVCFTPRTGGGGKVLKGGRLVGLRVVTKAKQGYPGQFLAVYGYAMAQRAQEARNQGGNQGLVRVESGPKQAKGAEFRVLGRFDGTIAKGSQSNQGTNVGLPRSLQGPLSRCTTKHAKMGTPICGITR